MNLEQFTKMVKFLSKTAPIGAPDFSDPGVVKWLYSKFDDHETALEVIGKLCESGKFPSVEQVKKSMDPKAAFTPDQIASDAIIRIRNAVTKYGYSNTQSAKQYIGPLGWKVVEFLGGWEAVCSAESFPELDLCLARAREFTKTLVIKEQSGIDPNKALSPVQKNTIADNSRPLLTN